MKLEKNIHSIASTLLQTEADAIKNLITYLNEDFDATVRTILQSRGRVVVTGIGKSAIIGQKIVATLNSTGTPSLFMHAADAIHGDLGMIQPDDIVIAISKSGDTPEIKVLVPLLKRTGSKLIAMVSNTESYLAQQADFVLNAYVEREACPNNLAPTTSTTATLALGDALAVCLLECRNFTSEDFARLHPGGTLGKKLYLRVSDLYKNNTCPTVGPDAQVKDIILNITSHRLGATAVINDKGDLLGIITDGDLRRMLNKHENLAGLKATDIMTVQPKAIDADEYAVVALKLMQDKNITQLVVTENNRLAGFLHIHDLLREGIV